MERAEWRMNTCGRVTSWALSAWAYVREPKGTASLLGALRRSSGGCRRRARGVGFERPSGLHALAIDPYAYPVCARAPSGP